jgi:hypothetical protein
MELQKKNTNSQLSSEADSENNIILEVAPFGIYEEFSFINNSLQIYS